MKKMSAIRVSVVAGCILAGCGSLDHQAACDNPLPMDYSATYHVTLEREVLVELNDPDSDAIPQKQTETLRFVSRVQPVSGHDGRYRVEFTEIAASRTDFLNHVILTDPVDDLAGTSFDVSVDEEGHITNADAFVGTLKTLARGCETCHQGHDCGQRTLKEQNFLLDVWAIQELVFRASKASQNLVQADEWTSTRQLPSVLPGEKPYVTVEWRKNTNRDGVLIAYGDETLTSSVSENSLPELFHPHIRPKGLLGYLVNCNYDSINGQVTLEAGAGTGLPLQISREAAMSANAHFTLSRQPNKSTITVWEILKIQQSPALHMYSSNSP